MADLQGNETVEYIKSQLAEIEPKIENAKELIELMSDARQDTTALRSDLAKLITQAGNWRLALDKRGL